MATSEEDSTPKFGPGNPGRPKGAKNKLQEAFWEDFAAAWEKHGVSALEKVAVADPSTFVKVAASTMPKDVKLDLDTRYVIHAPLPNATSEEWEADCQANGMGSRH